MNNHRGARTKGQIEAEIAEAVTRFEKEFMGRGPTETKAYLVDDMVIVRLKGVLTPAEQQLATGGGDPRGRDLIKQVRLALVEKGRMLLEMVVESITGCRVISLHADVSTVTGREVLVFELDGVPPGGRRSKPAVIDAGAGP